jgi:hypothetical protein
MLNKQILDSIGAKYGTLAKRVAETKADDNALATSIAAVVGEITRQSLQGMLMSSPLLSKRVKPRGTF